MVRGTSTQDTRETVGRPAPFGMLYPENADDAVESEPTIAIEDDDVVSEEPAPSRTTASLSKADAARFRKMVDDHFDFIWRSLRGLGVPSSAIDDAAQHVFWTASQKLAFITPGSERAYLFATARGTAANARRARQRNRELLGDEVLATHVDARPNPEQAASTREARRLLDQVLDTMDEDLREVFVLFELEGQTTAEISTLLSTPMGTVASRLRRAREEFQLAVRRMQAGKGGTP